MNYLEHKTKKTMKTYTCIFLLIISLNGISQKSRKDTVPFTSDNGTLYRYESIEVGKIRSISFNYCKNINVSNEHVFQYIEVVASIPGDKIRAFIRLSQMTGYVEALEKMINESFKTPKVYTKYTYINSPGFYIISSIDPTQNNKEWSFFIGLNTQHGESGNIQITKEELSRLKFILHQSQKYLTGK
jgi:hypothetical protein